MSAERSCDVAVVGGGAAGLMAAWWAAQGRAEVVVLEGSKSCGRKILISGGGRCNLLPMAAADDDFYTQGSRNVLRRILRTWPLPQVREFFEHLLGLPLIDEEETGRVFPRSQSAREVRDRLVAAAAERGVALLVPWRVASIEQEMIPGRAEFLLAEAGGARLRARRVILAAGGCSVPATGSDGSGYRLAAALGHQILAPYPALVPLTCEDPAWRELAGVSVPVRWRVLAGGKVMEERVRPLLFTHRGFSGPAVLDASHWVVRDGARLEVAWGALGREDWEEHWRSRGRRECARAVADLLPRRLAELLVARAGLRQEERIGSLTRPQRERLLAALCATSLPVTGNEGFRIAEVSGGGVPLGEVRPSTLESRKAAGLYLCGEILDPIGRMGGYNFLWAWITARMAGEAARTASAE